MDELNAFVEDPRIWNEPERAQEIMRERQRLDEQIQRVRAIESELDDALALAELGETEGDEETVTEAQETLTTLRERARREEVRALLSGEADANDCYIQVNAGAGGTEAQDWARMLLRMYVRWCQRQGYTTELLDETEGEEAGIKSATVRVYGDNAYGWLKAETGVHRLVRMSPFDSGGRRHTSFASVWVTPVIDDRIEIDIQPSDVKIDTFRASGAGGQHVNTTDSAVRIHHLPTGIIVQSQSSRSQHSNRAEAYALLRSKLYQRELKRREEEAKGVQEQKADIGWGNQIRSYVLEPYRMVKDLRTGLERSETERVLDGDIDRFLEAALAQRVAPGQDEDATGA